MLYANTSKIKISKETEERFLNGVTGLPLMFAVLLSHGSCCRSRNGVEINFADNSI